MPKDLLTKLLDAHRIAREMGSLFDAILDSFGLMVFKSSSLLASLGCDNAHLTSFTLGISTLMFTITHSTEFLGSL